MLRHGNVLSRICWKPSQSIVAAAAAGNSVAESPAPLWVRLRHTVNMPAYGDPTTDPLFKHVLMDSTARNSFLRAFVPHVAIKSSELLGQHMNPLVSQADSDVALNFLLDKESAKIVSRLQASRLSAEGADGVDDPAGSAFMKKVFSQDVFPSILQSIKPLPYGGTMDFACKTDSGEYVIVEMQVRKESSMDQRGLIYAAAKYSGQMRRGDGWNSVQRVIAVNILGKKDVPHFTREGKSKGKGSALPWLRHYVFWDQHSDPSNPRIMPRAIELLQYEVCSADLDDATLAPDLRDWMR